jgi:hypothetical protein
VCFATVRGWTGDFYPKETKKRSVFKTLTPNMMVFYNFLLLSGHVACRVLEDLCKMGEKVSDCSLFFVEQSDCSLCV